MAKRKFSEKFMKSLSLPTKEQGDQTYLDTRDVGKALVLRVSYGGTKTWKILHYVKVRNSAGKLVTVSRAKKIGRHPTVSVEAAYQKLADFDLNEGAAAFRAGTFGDIAARWLRSCVHDRGLRSARELQRHLQTYVLPFWGPLPIYDIRRAQVNELLDDIRFKKIRNAKGVSVGGRSQADAVLATIRNVMMWWVTQDDNYTSPITPRMKLKRDQRSLEERARRRVLNDEEIRALWAATEKLGHLGALVRLLLLTGQRLRKVAGMRWSDVANDVWTIPREPREKGNAGAIRLPAMALEVLARLHRVASSPFVFPASRGAKPFEGFSQLKGDLDKLLLPDMPSWVLHDLRRTVRTRMAELNIDDKIAELTLGHKIGGIESVYNLNSYFEPKSGAIARLATHLADVLNGREAKSNVVKLKTG